MVKGYLAISWSHRDRLSQTVNLTAQSAGNIGLESGVTYTQRIYGDSGSLQKHSLSFKRGAGYGLHYDKYY